MLIVAAGISNSGKTSILRSYVLPALLTNPKGYLDMCPARFGRALIDDPITRKNPKGQYPGTRYKDVSAWRRSPNKARICCFDNADTRELAGLAIELEDTILVLEELEFHIESERPLSPEIKICVHKGRQHGVIILGTMRRLHGIRKEARSNIQVYYVGKLDEYGDRNYAQKTLGVDLTILEKQPKHTFIEYKVEAGNRYLTRLTNGGRLITSI